MLKERTNDYICGIPTLFHFLPPPLLRPIWLWHSISSSYTDLWYFPKFLLLFLLFSHPKTNPCIYSWKVMAISLHILIKWLHTVNRFLDLIQVLPRNLLMENNVQWTFKNKTWPEHRCDGSTYSRLKRRVLSWTAVSTEVSLLSCNVFVKLWSTLSKSFCKISIGFGRHDECTINVLKSITTVDFKSIFTTKSR